MRIHVHMYTVCVRVCVCVCVCVFECAGQGLGGVEGALWLIPPAEDHTKLCSVDLPQYPKAAAPAAASEPAPFQRSPFFSLGCDHNKHLSKRISKRNLPGVI